MARQKDKEATIRNAAFDIFRENGFSNASMKDIAVKAGLGKGTLYEYFQNKEDLFIHVVQEKANHFFVEVNKRMTAKNELRDKLNEIIKITQETIDEIDFFFKFLMFGQFFDMNSDTKQKFKETILSNRENYMNLLRELFKKGAAEGVLREFDLEFVTNLTTEMITAHCCHEKHLLGDCWVQQQKDSDREKIVDFILNGITNKKD